MIFLFASSTSTLYQQQKSKIPYILLKNNSSIHSGAIRQTQLKVF